MKRGFTLIELIVVITIIAVITAVGTISYGGATRKSRDSRRMADLEKYRVALEMARQIGSTYPTTLGALTTMNLMPTTLADPKSFSYYYNPTSNYTYELWAQMEDGGSTNSVSGTNNCAGTCNYKVLNP